MKTIQCTHRHITCRHKAIAIVVMRTGALYCLHDFIIFALCPMLFTCWAVCVSWNNFCFNKLCILIILKPEIMCQMQKIVLTTDLFIKKKYLAFFTEASSDLGYNRLRQIRFIVIKWSFLLGWCLSIPHSEFYLWVPLLYMVYMVCCSLAWDVVA